MLNTIDKVLMVTQGLEKHSLLGMLNTIDKVPAVCGKNRYICLLGMLNTIDKVRRNHQQNNQCKVC